MYRVKTDRQVAFQAPVLQYHFNWKTLSAGVT